jgi:uncharacterized metal-binding protein YceD (DUF177 family)
MTAPEFSRPVRLDTLGAQPRELELVAAPEERAALARRFGLLALDRLAADVSVTRRDEDIALHGTLRAEVSQACVASAAPVPATLSVPFDLRFRPQPAPGGADEEVELGEGELDVVFYESGEIDLGEAVAETLALNLDPWPRAPDADMALRAAGVQREGEEEKESPFSVLAGLKGKLPK